jgi:hypothetical protein
VTSRDSNALVGMRYNRFVMGCDQNHAPVSFGHERCQYPGSASRID